MTISDACGQFVEYHAEQKGAKDRSLMSADCDREGFGVTNNSPNQ